MKKFSLSIITVLMLLALGGWLIAPETVNAAGNEIETIAARSMVKGYLSGLEADYLDPATLASLYLAKDLAVAGESENPFAALRFETYDITTETWLDDQTYQAEVVLNSGSQTIRFTVSKLTNRWQITEIVQLDATVVTSIADNSVSEPVISTEASTLEGKLILQPETGGLFYLVNADGTGLQPLTTGIDPVFSPDGTQIAFTRWGSGDDGAVWIYDLASGEEWALLGEMRQVKSPTWSVDGSQLVVVYQSGGQPYIEEICTDPGSRIPREAYDINRGSETGRICYKLPADPHRKLRLIDVATGEFEDLPSYTYSFAPTWDPANPWRVVYVGERGLIQLDLNRGEYFAFTADVRDRGPVFSPDGSMVAVSYKQDNHWEIYTISTSDGTRTRLTSSSFLADTPANNAAPAWSPDGSQIAFVTDRTGQWEFWIMDADGSNQRLLLSPETAEQLTVQYNGVDERLISWAQ